MSTMSDRNAGALLAISAATAMSVLPANAQQTEPQRTPLGSYAIAGKLVTHIQAHRLTFPPGFAAGRHDHPGPVVVYVTDGQVLVQVEGEPAKTYSAGETVLEPGDKPIARFDNASATAPASFIATYLLSDDDKALIRKLP